jgi:hypothetical protein
VSDVAVGLISPFAYAAGWHEVVLGTSPAAATQFIYADPGQYVSRLISVVFTLTTDGNAANRYVTVEHDQGQAPSYVVDAAGVVVTASSTQRFAGSYTRGVAEWAANTDVLFPLTPVFLDVGHRIRITYTNAQAADALSSIALVFERFPTGGDEYGSLPRAGRRRLGPPREPYGG